MYKLFVCSIVLFGFLGQLLLIFSKFSVDVNNSIFFQIALSLGSCKHCLLGLLLLLFCVFKYSPDNLLPQPNAWQKAAVVIETD